MKSPLSSCEPGRQQTTNKLNFHYNFKLGISQTYNPVMTRVRQEELQLEVSQATKLQASLGYMGRTFLTKQKFFILRGSWWHTPLIQNTKEQVAFRVNMDLIARPHLKTNKDTHILFCKQVQSEISSDRIHTCLKWFQQSFKVSQDYLSLGRSQLKPCIWACTCTLVCGEQR